MKVHWYLRKDQVGGVKYLDDRLMRWFRGGLKYHPKDSMETSWLSRFDGTTPADVAICYAYNDQTRAVMDAYLAAGKSYVMFDKGMVRELNKSHSRSRVMINAGHPLNCLMQKRRNEERWARLDIKLSKHRSLKPNAPIVFAMNSEKHSAFWGIDDAWDYSRRVVEEIRRHSNRPIIFRPKPKAEPLAPIEGTVYSEKPDHIEDALKGAWCLLTHTSSCAINALMMGIPAICLGPCAASPVSGDSVADVVDPRFPEPDEYKQWLHNLAWFEWAGEEFANGKAWDFIKREIA